MQKEILAELKALREAVVILAGSSELPVEQQLSEVVLKKAAKEFKKLYRENKAWMQDHELSKLFKGAPYNTGKFLREELKFTQYFMKGKSHYYNRKALLALARELKERKVNLPRYMEYKHEKEKFDVRVKAAAGQKKLAAFLLPDDMHDIDTSATPKPPKQLITDELARLQAEFEEYKMGDYLDVYKTFAVHKFDYTFAKFRDKAYRDRCKKWIENFNYASRALAALT